MREENFWYKKPRYSEVRVITRRVIARYDCIYKLAIRCRKIPNMSTVCYFKMYYSAFNSDLSVAETPFLFLKLH